jgi:ubiquinone/menaquinone biosynthesis C-methylase UbiE
MNIHSVYQPFQNYFRPKRKKTFITAFPEVSSGSTVLDVGGTASWWQNDFPKKIDITIINIDDRQRETVVSKGFKFFQADGRDLPFSDKEFDLTFSNSVIEHVGGIIDQEKFASEAVRCGKNLYLQTPNKWFPIEPHLMAPFVHWLPQRFSRHLIRYFSIWGIVTKPSQKRIDEFLSSIRLLSKKELRKMFPTAELTEEKFMGLTKSFILIIR